MSARLRRAAPVLIGLAVFLISLEVLRLELRAVSWPNLVADVLAVSPARLGIALVLTALNYLALTGYDLLAFSYVGKSLPKTHIAWASFLSYSISNNVGFAMLSGASVRYRLYSRWGVTGEEFSRIVVSYSVTFWLGLLALGGASLAFAPLSSLAIVPGHALFVPVGWGLMLVSLGYVAACAVRHEPLRVRQLELPMPSVGIAASQLLLSIVEWSLAGAVLFSLLPPDAVPFVSFLGAFLVAALLGMASHVPGGVGVFEGLMVLLLRPYLPSAELLPALIVFRAVYYLLPFAVGLVGLMVDEMWQRRAHIVRAGAAAGQLADQLTPNVLACATFLAGLVLLFSGATPAAAGRLEWLAPVLPLAVIEVSHFLGSVAGASLLVLSQGLARRLDAAYYLASTAIAVGMATSILKGVDYEEAAFLLPVLLLLWRARPAFDRRAAFFDTRFSATWVAALAGAIGATIWLGFFAFKHVDYSHELWWQFEVRGEASRFLRASVGAAVVFLLLGLARLIGYAPHEAATPTDDEIDEAGRIIAAQASTMPFLTYLRDKALLFSEDRSAFLMYSVQGRTWVALGDPVGREEQFTGLIRQFIERCDDFGGVPVFYEVSRAHLHRYADFGLAFAKLGEEARVDLTTFTLQGSRSAKYRQIVRRLEKDGCTFRMIPAADVRAALPQLREVSDDWLAAKASAEKGFSLGFFSDDYVARFPVAVIEVAGRIRAFTNIWPGGTGEELSMDMMRYHRDAPRSVMEALCIHVMEWGHQHGYRCFALGMAPLSGFEHSAVGSLWNRVAGFFYRHGDALYHFQGLRAYKEKFDPIWEPRYLAYPGGLRLPRITADVSALVAGGYRQIFRK